MSEKGIVGILLPTTQNIEKLPIPPIKMMREHNMVVALGSDFCPNAFCYNMGLTSHYACTNYRLTPKEAIVGATLNAAYALNLHEKVGSIEEGKAGDMLILDVENWVYNVYSFGDSYI